MVTSSWTMMKAKLLASSTASDGWCPPGFDVVCILFPTDTLKNAGLNSTSIILLPQWNYLMEHWRRWRPAAITAAVRTRERGAFIERHHPIDQFVLASSVMWRPESWCLATGALAAVDVQDLSRDERCRIKIEDSVVDIAHLADTAERM